MNVLSAENRYGLVILCSWGAPIGTINDVQLGCESKTVSAAYASVSLTQITYSQSNIDDLMDYV